MSEKTTERDSAALLGAVEAIARRAGHAILDIYSGEFDVEHKDDRTPITEADMAAHREIIGSLRDLDPETPVLSEESSHITFAERRRWRRYWLVDPLDGTREFIKRNGEFTVNIALIEDTEPVLGVVYAPVLDRTYAARRGGGAFRRDGEAEAAPIHARRLSEAPVTVAGSRSHVSEAMGAYLERLGRHELMPVGSALKFGLVAEGAADLYVRLGKTSEWDTGAGQCVVEEAGGHVTDTSMKPLRYNTKESLLNPEFFVFGDDSVDWSKYL